MQGLIAVESHGQVCMSGPLGDFAGVSVDAAGQVYSQNKSAAFVQTVHQPAGGKAGGPQCAMESGAVQGIHDHIKVLRFQHGAVGADVHRQGMQTLKIGDGICGFGFAFG